MSNGAKKTRPSKILARVRSIHRPFGLYDECGHHHAAGEPGVIDIDDIGRVCKEGKMYDICWSCCTDDHSQHEMCASAHDHGPGKPICATAAALDEAAR